MRGRVLVASILCIVALGSIGVPLPASAPLGVEAATLPALSSAGLTLPRTLHLSAQEGQRGEPLHECRDIWEVLNPLANCLVDPTHPVRNALGDAIKKALNDFAIGVIDDIATGLDTVLTWGNQDDPSSAANPGLLARTPAQYSYAHPVVVEYWTLCRFIADGALALLFLLAGFEVMLGTRAGRSYDGALDALRYILLAAVLANASLPLIGLILEVGNALCGVVGGAISLPAAVAMHPADETVAHALFRLLYLVVSALVLVQMFVRLAFLDLLIILSPIGLLCLASPRTRRWAQTWTHLFVATAIQQVLQLLALHVCSDLMDHLPGLDAPTDSVVSILVGCGGLLLVFRLPRLLAGVAALGPLPTVAGMAGAVGDEAARRGAAREAATTRARRAVSRSAGGQP